MGIVQGVLQTGRGNRACNIKTSELFSGSGRRTGVMAAGYPDERLWCARGFETD